MSAMDEYESVLLVKNEVFIYKIPPRTTNRSYRAADWNLAVPDWTGRMRLVSKKNDCVVKLEDKITGELFAKAPIDKYPGAAIEAVSDSSRYFVIRLQEEDGRTAFIGLGFGDRSDSFDLNVALQDHFKWIKKEEDAEKEKVEGTPNLDLGFKDGQTIKINMKITRKEGQEGQEGVSRPKAKTGGGGLGLLPPPPGGVKLPPPPSGNSATSPTVASPVAPVAPQNSCNLDLLGGLSAVPDNPPSQPAAGTDSWGDFASANTNSNPPPPAAAAAPAAASSAGGGAGWVTF